MGIFDFIVNLLGKNPMQISKNLRRYSVEFCRDIYKIAMPDAKICGRDVNPIELLMLGMFIVQKYL